MDASGITMDANIQRFLKQDSIGGNKNFSRIEIEIKRLKIS
jgi:hypothetical protein